MSTRRLPQHLPSAGPAREALREKGQFWTPAWLAEPMVVYVLRDGSDHLFDPAVGAGAFFQAAKVLCAQSEQRIQLLGTEKDAHALAQALQNGLTADDLSAVNISDFVRYRPSHKFKAIVANPPYIRHHRLPVRLKAELKAYSSQVLGVPLDGRAGLHVYFLLCALQSLDVHGRLAFVMPADTCEGKFAPPLWNWITAKYCLDAVLTFAPDATPFPSVDTNAMVFFIQHAKPRPTITWARCNQAGSTQLRAWVSSGFASDSSASLDIQQRDLEEALTTGLSRPPRSGGEEGEYEGYESTLGEFATAMRGVATGANDFFFLTSERVAALGLSESFLRRAVGRTRDVDGAVVTAETLLSLEATGRPTWLLALDGQPQESFPDEVRRYLRYGEELRLPQRPLISQRKPWYKMEARAVPPILFAYLGRRNARFIRNQVGVVPLTGFLCVYPRESDPQFIEKLWKVLSHPATVANLARVGKSYGSGAIKVEPRALESLPLPRQALEEAELESPRKCVQPRLFEDVARYPI